jgi:taurine--2-oxoglutarate transaminase
MGLTYFGHPMSCAAAVATLKIYSEENLIENSKRLGLVLGEGLEEIKKKHSTVGDVRYIGLFSVIELVRDRDTKEPLQAELMGEIKSSLLADGITTFINKNMVFICPPLCINQDELLIGLQIIDQAIGKIELHK